MLIGVDLVSELVGSVLMTGSLTNDSPVSLMLIAAPESGKTSIVLGPDLEDRVVCSDATGGGICDQLMQHPKLHHIIIADMVAVMAHKEQTNKRTWSILNALTEEGLSKISLPGNAAYDFQGRKAGIIACIPLEMVSDGRMWWQRTGFSSRFLPFCYEYSKALVLAIKQNVIMSGAYERANGNGKKPFLLPDKAVDVVIEGAYCEKVQAVADKVARHLNEKGLRRGKQFRSLARGHALYRKSKRVQDTDIEFLLRVFPYVSYQVAQEL